MFLNVSSKLVGGGEGLHGLLSVNKISDSIAGGSLSNNFCEKPKVVELNLKI